MRLSKILTTILTAALMAVSTAMAHEGQEHPAGNGLFGLPPEYVHVLLNPMPVYGLGIGVLALAAALFARSKAAQVTALSIVILASASAWPVAHFGQSAYEAVRGKADEPGQQWLDVHMERAEKLIYVFYATALLGIAALASQKKFPKAATPLTVATLMAGFVSLGVGGWMSKAGGQIRHPEFRAESAPSTDASSHEHGATSEQTAAEKTPLPDTLDGVWKVIHEHHGELASAVNAKKFHEVQRHGEMIRALAKRLVDLTQPLQKTITESTVSKMTRALDELKSSAETGSEFVMKTRFKEFQEALVELEQQIKK